ncbi:Ubiquitin carboxyl-terminal hydrolase, partial [Globisporangium splendens]
MARIAAVFFETVDSIVIEHCTFEKIGGNAIVVSGESDRVRLANNNISFVGSNGIAILARRAFRRNAWATPVLSKLLYSRNANVSFNQIHHFGRRVAHSAAIMAVGVHQAVIQGNLVYHFPTSSSGPHPLAGTSYLIENAHGTNYDDASPLIRTVTPFTIPQTLAQNLATQYVVPITGFDIPIIAKIIGAPQCPSGTGRIGALYGDSAPFTYTQCSGCCSLHANFAKIRVAGSGVAWTDATSRQIVVQPSETIELAATSSAFFNSVIDVYVAFHVVTPNQIIELPSSSFARWQILTRRCKYTKHTYTATCSGPCTGVGSTGCGNSNIAIQQNGHALTCDPGYEADVNSHVCTGPFAATSDCEGTGIAQPRVYYNCSIACFTTACA